MLNLSITCMRLYNQLELLLGLWQNSITGYILGRKFSRQLCWCILMTNQTCGNLKLLSMMEDITCVYMFHTTLLSLIGLQWIERWVMEAKYISRQNISAKGKINFGFYLKQDYFMMIDYHVILQMWFRLKHFSGSFKEYYTKLNFVSGGQLLWLQ